MNFTITKINAVDYRKSDAPSIPSHWEHDLYQFHIFGDLYSDIRKYALDWVAENEKAKSDPGGYSNGLIEKPSVIGAVGEVAVATIMYGLPNNIATVKSDDGYDYMTSGMNWSMWVTVSDIKNNQKIEYPLKADWYVAVKEDAHKNKDDDGWATITVLGRVSRASVIENTIIEPGNRPDNGNKKHHVRKVGFGLLECMPEADFGELDIL
jgi:hypothetical protein